MSTPQPSPVEAFLAMLAWLSRFLFTGRAIQVLPQPVLNRAFDRIRVAKFRLQRLAERIAAGTFKPRRSAERKPPANPKPRENSPIALTFGWLGTLLPETRGFGRALLAEIERPELQALIAAAPAETARIIRPLCWMLGLKPPQNLPAPPRRRPANPPPRRKTPPRPKVPNAPAAGPAHHVDPVLLDFAHRLYGMRKA